MKNAKLWLGILGILIAGYFLIVSCYEASWNYLTSSGHINGITGILIASLFLAGSIVRIIMRGAEDDSGSIISLVLFGSYLHHHDHPEKQARMTESSAVRQLSGKEPITLSSLSHYIPKAPVP